MAIDVDLTPINDVTILTAINTPGGLVRDYMEDYAEDIKKRAIRSTIQRIGNGGKDYVANAATRGGTVGTYLASFYIYRLGSNQYEIHREVGNAAPHGVIVEEGRPTVRKVQRFSWVHAKVRTARKPGKKGGYELGASTPGKILNYRRTNRRKGKHIVQNAVRRASRARGITY